MGFRWFSVVTRQGKGGEEVASQMGPHQDSLSDQCGVPLEAGARRSRYGRPAIKGTTTIPSTEVR